MRIARNVRPAPLSRRLILFAALTCVTVAASLVVLRLRDGDVDVRRELGRIPTPAGWVVSGERTWEGGERADRYYLTPVPPEASWPVLLDTLRAAGYRPEGMVRCEVQCARAAPAQHDIATLAWTAKAVKNGVSVLIAVGIRRDDRPGAEVAVFAV